MSFGIKKMMSTLKKRRPKRLFVVGSPSGVSPYAKQAALNSPRRQGKTKPTQLFPSDELQRNQWKKSGEICSTNFSYIPNTVLYMSGRPVAKCEPKLRWVPQHDTWSHPTDDSALGKWGHMLVMRFILKYCVNNWKTFKDIHSTVFINLNLIIYKHTMCQ